MQLQFYEYARNLLTDFATGQPYQGSVSAPWDRSLHSPPIQEATTHYKTPAHLLFISLF